MIAILVTIARWIQAKLTSRNASLILLLTKLKIASPTLKVHVRKTVTVATLELIVPLTVTSEYVNNQRLEVSFVPIRQSSFIRLLYQSLSLLLSLSPNQ
jgi:hypothetical protein